MGEAGRRLTNAGVSLVDPSGGAAKLLAPPWNAPAIEVRNLRSGALLRRWQLPIRDTTAGDSVTFSGRYLVVGERLLRRFDVASGKALGTSRLSGGAGPLSASGRWAVCGIGRRSVWAEPFRKGSRVRELDLPARR